MRSWRRWREPLENLLVDTNVLTYEAFEDSEHHSDATDILIWELADTLDSHRLIHLASD